MASTDRVLTDSTFISNPQSNGDSCQPAAASSEFSIFTQKIAQLGASPRELWFVFVLKGLFSLSYFALSNVLVLYLTLDFGFSDATAGWIYGCEGLLAGVLGLFGGIITDQIGTNAALRSGAGIGVLAYGIIAFTRSPTMVVAALLLLRSFSGALVMPAMMISVRRHTTPRNRGLGFSFFYVVMNFSAFLAYVVLSGVRTSYALSGGSAAAAGGSFSIWRCIAVFAFFVMVVQLLLSLMLRAPESDLEPPDAQERPSTAAILSDVLSNSKFRRFVIVVAIFIGVRSVFRHLDATFPKYFMRTFGEDARFELIAAINPMFILIFTPLVTFAIERLNCSYSFIFILGSVISGASPLLLTLGSSYSLCIAFVLMLSVGEAVWSPKLYEYSIAVAPVGREATYSGVAAIPTFLAAGMIGGFSGSVLEKYCGSGEDCQGQWLWLIIGLTTITSPIGLLLLRRQLFDPSDLAEDERAGLSETEDLGGETYGGTASSAARLEDTSPVGRETC